MNRRKICVVTGSRADYGLLFWLLKALQSDERADLQLVVTGAHLSPEFGLTIATIRSDGFDPAAEVEMLVSSDTAIGTSKSVGLAMIGFADSLSRLRPEIVVVIGDRFETLAAAQAALIAGIPLAHIHGGEVTEGAVDEQIRHAVTKMAGLHFVTAEPHRRRVIQMGEQPDRVHLVGAPGLDNIANLRLLDRSELASALAIDAARPTFLVTYHPATLGTCAPENAMAALLEALDAYPDHQVVMTMPNADPGGRRIAQMAHEYAARSAHRVRLEIALGQVLYLSTMKHADVVIGNSSSGLIEAPPLGTPTVNIGPRQRGRLRADTVLDCAEDKTAIVAAIARARSADVKAVAARMPSPYGKPGHISRAIRDIVVSTPLETLIHKTFFDLG